ncbi:centlein [Conger conger]|uniref:centlein n=1 Tax=Conger conger TaxID=82655 RepID=UPI002A59B40C|nr:centlein [Conger conger]
MAAKDSHRILLLEEEVRNLSEELIQCQADKEFVWSLWKRLQVANPDLTQAVSLVVEREKQKGEAKDRKVLEILQVKDYKIQELEQRVTAQLQEMNSLSQRARSTEEDHAVMKKDMAALRQKLKEKGQELKACQEERRRREAEQQGVVRELQEGKAGLDTRCACMQSDLEKLLEQAEQWAQEKTAVHATALAFEGELKEVKQQAADLQERCSSLTAQLSSRDQELEQMDEHVTRLKQDQQQLQALYTQSVEHAGDQAQLIKQLEELNLDTQRVLRTQEAAHCADSASYQRLYSDLNESFQALKASEAQLRQAQISMTTQLCQKDQEILHLQTRLQLQVATATVACSPVRQSNYRPPEERLKRRSGRRESVEAEQSPLNLSPTPNRDTQTNLRISQGASVQRSRSLSPGSASGGRMGPFAALKRAEARVQDLEDLLRLKTEENAELKLAHENRQERLQALQDNYKTVREQLKQAEESQDHPRPRKQRAQPWELRHENSDGVWNELAYFKRLTKNLSTEKANLEEEVDVLRVQAAVDRVAVQEMRMCLQQEREELLQKEAEGAGVTCCSSPKTASLGGTADNALQVEQLQKQAWSLEKEVELLQQTNQDLRAANGELSETREQLQTAMLRLRSQAAARQQADRAWQQGVVQELEGQLGACRRQLAQVKRDGARVRQQLQRARQELGLLRAARDYSLSRAPKAHGNAAIASASFRGSSQPRPPRCRGRTRPTSPRANKDGWEDISAESDSGEEYTDSLNSPLPVRTQTPCDRQSRGSSPSQHALQARDVKDARPEAGRDTEPGNVQVQRGWRGRRRRGGLSRALQQRIGSLQQQVTVLQAARKAASSSAQELQLAQDRMTSQLSALTQKLNASKQLSQKLTSDLTASEQQRAELQRELEELRQRSPRAPTPTPDPPNTAEAELKGLQAKLKNACNEATKHTLANKSLKTELQAKDEQVKELQEKVSHMDRDITMKRQLVEDLRSKMKTFQDNDKSLKTLIEDLESKVKVLSEEAVNRKAFVDSLKRRLSVTGKERNEYEQTSHKLRKHLDKKDQKLQALQARVLQCEDAMAELERTASQQMHGLAQQSTQALDALQRKLGVANAQLEHLHAFVQALAGELHSDMQEVRVQLRKHRRRKLPENSRQSKESLMRAQCIAASILNVSHTDLQDILDPEQNTEEIEVERRKEQHWLDQVMKLLQQQIPSVSLLMEAMRSKLRERTVLTEELASLKTHASNTQAT